MLKKRACGVLLHITSLPTEYGIGDMGPNAYEFIKFLKDAGQSYWQVLPLNYTTADANYSPYNCFSAFAGNPLLISPELLYRQGLLQKDELRQKPQFPAGSVDYRRVDSWKSRLFDKAFIRFGGFSKPCDYTEFVEQNDFWLDDFATFVALKHRLGGRNWSYWPAAIRDKKPNAMPSIKKQLKKDIEREILLQYLWFKQYHDLKALSEKKGISLIGDIPIYVAYDSADVWANPQIFKLNSEKRPKYIAGVPPDYFSHTGQLWGNPVYNWQYLQGTDYAWWMQRMRHNLRLFDLVRIDHFRGFVAYWQVPAGHKTAVHGRWVKAPADNFFKALFKQFPFAAIFAEDLGYITADVREIVSRFGFPCMKVLQFGFDDSSKKKGTSDNPHCPCNYIENCLVYTGTHDNNTTKGWFQKEATARNKHCLYDYLGHKVTGKTIHWEMIRLAMASVAKVAIIPMQDLLGSGSDARMNNPRKSRGNWLWRMNKGQITAALARKLNKMVSTYNRG